MNSDIKNNMKFVLKKKVEKKCNKNGYVDEVYRILEFSDGIMPAENLNACAIYNITYHCKLCIPVENTVLIGKVKLINMELIVALNGPIIFFLPNEYIDTNIWDIMDGYMNKTTQIKLMAGDYIKIQVIEKRINMNDTQIKSFGRLLDIATEEEVEKYFGSKVVNDKLTSIVTTDENTESNFII